MRVFGFSEKWPKLHLELPVQERPDFTSFRLPRKDADRGRDWALDETLQIVYKPRSPHREVLGIATIIAKESPRTIASVSGEEAEADGFVDLRDMLAWFCKTHGPKACFAPGRYFNKLTFRWEARV